MSEFVDTNILIYAHDRSAGPKHDRASDLVVRLTEDGSGALSTQVLIEFYAVATRKLRRPVEEAEAALEDLGCWTIHRLEHADLMRAVRLQRRHRISWWDALIINSAIELGCEILWSEDLAHGQRFGSVRVQDPFVS